MCGIAGFIHSTSADPARLGTQLNKLIHRGPDGNGIWSSNCGRVVFGHRRLSVIDLSSSSQQPMTSQDGRYTIIFNGELYNFAALRHTLTGLGHRFHSTGDTEVLLAAFVHWGPDCLEHLNGMFAFAIHDRGNAHTPASVFIARDRAGEKPLYFAPSASEFWFASELKALPHQSAIDLQALNHYLSLGYIPAGMCLFSGVQKLPPAHCAKLSLDTFKLDIWRYWSLPPNQSSGAEDGEALADEAAALIEDSVRLRLVADVPVGVMLSGGLDSSLVVGAAARVSAKAVETFTISLPGSHLDEAHHAQKVASHFGTRHHVLPLQETSLQLLDGLAPFIDEPIADSSILPAWMVFGLARQQVTVALGGDGGDELFGGYSDYTTSLADASRWGWVSSPIMAGVASAAAMLPAGVRGRNRLASLRHGPLQQMIWGRPYFDQTLRRRILQRHAVNELGEELGQAEQFLLKQFLQGRDPVDSMTRTHFNSILPDDFLVKVDRASMAHSLEVRAPFLDHRLIEFAFGRLPSSWKVHNGESRRLQRILARRWLPRDLDVQRKQGFSIPLNEWLRQAGEKDLMRRMESLPALFNLDEVHALVRGHLAGRANGGRLFALIMLAIAMKNA
ncbi:asparagine synthase (glutamine-hydrolyzing) [Oxalicibacterium faecigallinarum]|nr:asparagine synthase (glutamine-hydrolyzing) [Oxalicibacterium faecigallinarum]